MVVKTYCMPWYVCHCMDIHHGITVPKVLANCMWLGASQYDVYWMAFNILLNEICGDMPVQDQLYIRFINFYRTLLNSNNMLTKAYANLALQGSNLTVSNNITIISSHLSKSRCEIVHVHKSQFDDVTIRDDASVIREILYSKHCNLFTPTYSSFFTNDQLNCVLNTLCTM